MCSLQCQVASFTEDVDIMWIQSTHAVNVIECYCILIPISVFFFSQGLADNTVVAKVNGELWDLDRPFEEDSELKLLKFEDPEGQYVFWHSSAHILGEAMEKHYGGHLCYGPPIDTGFYYDMWLEDRAVAPSEFSNLDQLVKKIVKEKQPFERLEMKKEDLLKMFEVSFLRSKTL